MMKGIPVGALVVLVALGWAPGGARGASPTPCETDGTRVTIRFKTRNFMGRYDAHITTLEFHSKPLGVVLLSDYATTTTEARMDIEPETLKNTHEENRMGFAPSDPKAKLETADCMCTWPRRDWPQRCYDQLHAARNNLRRIDEFFAQPGNPPPTPAQREAMACARTLMDRFEHRLDESVTAKWGARAVARYH